MAASRITLKGAKELQKLLKTLPLKVEKKVLRKALRAGAKVIQQEAKALAPVDTGQLKASIKVRAAKRMKRGTVGVQVITGDGDFKGDQFYGAFIEYGYQRIKPVKLADGTFFTPKNGERETVPPRPFMRPAADNKGEEAGRIVAEKIRDGVEAEAKKLR